MRLPWRRTEFWRTAGALGAETADPKGLSPYGERGPAPGAFRYD